MSTFICSERTYARICGDLKMLSNSTSRIQYNIRPLLEYVTANNKSGDPIKNIIKEFYTLNVDAVNQRYGDSTSLEMPADTQTKAFRFDPNVSPYQFLKSLECLKYQMSEGTVPQQLMYTVLVNFIEDIAEEILQSLNLYYSAEELAAGLEPTYTAKDFVHSLELYKSAEWD